MRERFGSKGNLIGGHEMVFDSIGDDYKIQSIFLDGKISDYSYLSIIKHLKDIRAGEEFDNKSFYSETLLYNLSLDYINSAICLIPNIEEDRNKEIVSYYYAPCAFLCRHSIELLLKSCLLARGDQTVSGHSLVDLWKEIDINDYEEFDDLDLFIKEVNEIDKFGEQFRYGITKELDTFDSRFDYDIRTLLINTMYLFNVLEEKVICRYHYKGK